MSMRKTFLFAAAVASLGACKWSEFDDLSSEAHVAATERPDNSSTIWPIALAPVPNPGTGGKVAVLGASEPIYNEIVLGDTGTAGVGPNVFEFEDIGWGQFQTDPIVLVNPDDPALPMTGNGEIAVITQPASTTVMFTGKNAGFTFKELPESTTVDAATYLRVGTNAASLVAGEDDKLWALDRVQVLHRCNLREAAMPVALKAMASVVPSGATEEHLLIWDEDGRLMLYPAAVINGDPDPACLGGMSGEPLLISTATAFTPALHSFLVRDDAIFGADKLLLVGRNGPSTFLQLVQVSTGGITFIGTPFMTEASSSHAVLKFDSPAGTYVALGFQTATVDNTVAGQVKVHAVDPIMGVDSTPVLILSDSQPEDNQGFGKALAAVPFNGKSILVVGANNEVFTYFQTELYEDTRTTAQ